jgi:hypothetical protein
VRLVPPNFPAEAMEGEEAELGEYGQSNQPWVLGGFGKRSAFWMGHAYAHVYCPYVHAHVCK